MTRDVSNAASPWLDWHGLGGWNIYFLAKFALLWAGYLNFHPLINLVFAAFLIFPLPSTGLRRIRHWLETGDALPLRAVARGAGPAAKASAPGKRVSGGPVRGSFNAAPPRRSRAR